MPSIVMLPPQTGTTRAWAARLGEAVPQLSVVVAADGEQAARALAGAEAAYGTLPAALLKHATRLRWLQAPQAAPAARLAEAFGMHVIGVDARRREAPPGVSTLDGPDALDSLLPLADFVILTVPHTPATEGFMHRARLQRMKRSAFFINIGRGMTTRLDDLVAALRAGEIAGAALDVFEQEPLPADHPLWTTPNVLITPHTAGYGPYLDDRRCEILLDNCRRFLDGHPLRNVVYKSRWF